MMTIKDSIGIDRNPETTFDGLISVFSTEKHFKRWHEDHVKCQWLRGRPFEKGSVLYVEEYLHGELHKMKFLCIGLEPNRRIDFRLLFPASILCPGGSFSMVPRIGGCIFTATLAFRMGGLLSRIAKGRVEEIKRHMREEGEGLKRLLEGGEL